MVEIPIICNRMNKIKVTKRFEKRRIRFLKEILPNIWDAIITKLLHCKLFDTLQISTKNVHHQYVSYQH